jgi:TonB family protein
MLIALIISVLSASAQDTRKILTKPAPAYPDIARRISLTGTVKLQIVIGTDGKVKDVSVIGGHPVLITAAVEAVKKWRYEPMRQKRRQTFSSTSNRYNYVRTWEDSLG